MSAKPTPNANLYVLSYTFALHCVWMITTSQAVLGHTNTFEAVNRNTCSPAHPCNYPISQSFSLITVASDSCSGPTGVETDCVFCCCSSSASSFDMLRCFSAHRECEEWLFELSVAFLSAQISLTSLIDKVSPHVELPPTGCFLLFAPFCVRCRDSIAVSEILKPTTRPQSLRSHLFSTLINWSSRPITGWIELPPRDWLIG